VGYYIRLRHSRRQQRFCVFQQERIFAFIEREFGWSRTPISRAFSLARIESGLMGPIEGHRVNRVGPRRIMFIGICICFLGFISLSFVSSLPMLYASIVLGMVSLTLLALMFLAKRPVVVAR
jgi:MFS family permease